MPSSSTSSCGLKSYSCTRWSIKFCKIRYFENFYSTVCLCYVYEVNLSLQLKSKTSIIIYYVIVSLGCALASSLELWLPRNDDCCILYELFIKQINRAFATEIEPLVQINRSYPFLLCCCGLRTCLNAS